MAIPTFLPALEAQGLIKTFGEGPTAVRALRGVDICVAASEFVAIMGPSGSGKSTLLHICGALDRRTDGSVEIHGQPLRHPWAPGRSAAT